ncbi:hypothetical protein ZHAS_00000095 [Anopheles sinensis]|uniref:ZAD domain-containing protein n=1 Tax=Anopheles sinensis TaxID=74873 RepID=A0A084V9U6_ANOSI|nr:hypothetical protein ZHAS_00000095 [Anopheles sinensis]
MGDIIKREREGAFDVGIFEAKQFIEDNAQSRLWTLLVEASPRELDLETGEATFRAEIGDWYCTIRFARYSCDIGHHYVNMCAWDSAYDKGQLMYALYGLKKLSGRRYMENCSIYETFYEDEGATNLHTMLVKLYPTVFNESQMLCDEALEWPMKICKECKTKVVESYRFYERCTKSARSLRTIALKEQSTTDALQEEKDDHPAVIKTEFIEFEEATVLKEEYDSEDHSSAYNKYNGRTLTEDVFSDTADSLTTPTDAQNNSLSANKVQQKQCIKSAAFRGK